MSASHRGCVYRCKRPLDGSSVESAIFHHWRTLRNSELLEQAHQHGFTALVTADKRLATEHPRPPIAVIAVDDNRLRPLRAAVHDIANAIRVTPPRSTSARANRVLNNAPVAGNLVIGQDGGYQLGNMVGPAYTMACTLPNDVLDAITTAR